MFQHIIKLPRHVNRLHYVEFAHKLMIFPQHCSLYAASIKSHLDWLFKKKFYATVSVLVSYKSNDQIFCEHFVYIIQLFDWSLRTSQGYDMA